MPPQSGGSRPSPGGPRGVDLDEFLAGVAARRPHGEHQVVVVLIGGYDEIAIELGYRVADEILAALLVRLLAREWLVGPSRIATDKVAVCAVTTDPDRLGEQLSRELSAPVPTHAGSIELEIGIGIAVATEPYEDDRLLRSADHQARLALSTGRGVLVAQGAGAESLPNMHALQQEIRSALTSGEMELHYQPIVRADDYSLVCAEALVRWRRQDELVSPSSFIPAIERTSGMDELGRWVLQEAASALGSLQHERSLPDGFSCSVNVAARQMIREDLAEDFASIINASAVAPERFSFEITESSEITGTNAKPFMRRMQQLGAGVMLDDFGTHYSSISYLHRYPFDAVKIDREFISAVASRPDDYVIVEAVAKLAHSLGMIVIAEGVVSFEQVLQLRALGIDRLQGFLIAPPLPLFGLRRFIEIGPTLGLAGSRFMQDPPRALRSPRHPL
jgi:EAL domain-containing protein (putative c-di-GMP-specific phosphodiesterase class I)